MKTVMMPYEHILSLNQAVWKFEKIKAKQHWNTLKYSTVLPNLKINFSILKNSPHFLNAFKCI